jgi:RNA polymerase sigma-70 factor (ECF subfamily)
MSTYFLKFLLLVKIGSMATEYNLNNEHELIARIANKDKAALSTLYDNYSRLIYSLIYKVVQKHDDCEEVMHDVFLQIWEKAAYFNPEKGNVYVWIVTLARNKAIDRVRSKYYKQGKVNSELESVSLYLENDEMSALDKSLVDEKAGFVRQALAKLPENQRILLTDAYYLGFSQSELADRYELPLGTVKTRMRSGLQRLRTLIDGDLI